MVARPTLVMILAALALSAPAVQRAAAAPPHRPHATRIVGGNTATAPSWMVALLPTGGGDQAFCGASLIDPQWVLTAAHCLVDSLPGDLEVLVGQARLDRGTRHPVAEIFIHPAYLDPADGIDGDVALLRLATPVAGAAPVSLLAEAAAAHPGLAAWVLGWGATCEDCDGTVQLRQAFLEMHSRDTADLSCAYESVLSPDTVVAGLPEGGKDTCYGDSGGPILVQESGGGWTQVGVVSYGSVLGCAAAGTYGVYASVAWHRPWIDDLTARGEPAGVPFYRAFNLDSQSVNDPTRSGRHPARLLSLAGAVAGADLVLQATSYDFTPYLAVRATATGAVAALSPDTGQTATLAWSVPPAGGAGFQLVVSTRESGAAGGVMVSSEPHQDTIFSASFDWITPARAEEGTLTYDSPIQQTDDGDYYYQDFLIYGLPDGEWATFELTPAQNASSWMVDVYDYTLEDWVGTGDESLQAPFSYREDHWLVATVLSRRPGDFSLQLRSNHHETRSQVMRNLFGSTLVNLAAESYCSPWFGPMDATAYPLVEHTFLGTLLLAPAGGGFWFWQADLDWCWTSPTVWPFVYALPRGWLWNFPGAVRPQWFWDFGRSDWLWL